MTLMLLLACTSRAPSSPPEEATAKVPAEATAPQQSDEPITERQYEEGNRSVTFRCPKDPADCEHPPEALHGMLGIGRIPRLPEGEQLLLELEDLSFAAGRWELELPHPHLEGQVLAKLALEDLSLAKAEGDAGVVWVAHPDHAQARALAAALAASGDPRPILEATGWALQSSGNGLAAEHGRHERLELLRLEP